VGLLMMTKSSLSVSLSVYCYFHLLKACHKITDKEMVDLIFSILDSPYANYLIRQFVLASVTKMAARSTTTVPEQDRIAEVLAKYTTSPELELQQRAVEFASLFSLGEMRIGVLEQMPPPELKATVMGIGKIFSLVFFSH
jgi:AP-1 complex subunit gamma-1